MKILLDENIPKSLKKHLRNDYIVFTVQEMGWSRKKNGELLKLMLLKKFEVLITGDKNLRYQQNLKKIPISVLLLDVKPLRPDTIEQILPSILTNLQSENLHGVVTVR
ncbi:MAG: hypothetical protein COX07_06000 [Bacteroidetes bacterium CG23_combo_of_CG06-09_8_20_14_all_32_9]|nr:MAG: hypothetical protein COX07_06000 [Bacteroidetes bacterium CG23_combo_of_CG06-09_8_20_14_all_32_9]